MTDERYKKGFNQGYTLSEAGIELPRLDATKNGGNDYVQGLKEGVKEYRSEKTKSKGLYQMIQKSKPLKKSTVKSKSPKGRSR